MASGNASNRSVVDRIVDTLSRLHDVYDRIEESVGYYTPYLVRVAEVLLALALLAVLAHWMYWVYLVGV